MTVLGDYAFEQAHADDLEGPLDMVADVLTGGGAGLVRGVTGGGSTDKAPPGAGASPATSTGSLTGAVQQGITQGMGSGLTQNPLGSMMGLGLGGAIPGAGWLPDPMAMHAAHLFGQPYLPPAQQALSMLGGSRDEANYDKLANHASRVGREVVQQVLGITEPQLKELQKGFARAQLSRDATAEHRTLQGREAFRRQVLALLQQLVLQNRARGIAPPPRLNIVVPSSARGIVASLPNTVWRP